jgi:hypothetical protein
MSQSLENVIPNWYITIVIMTESDDKWW